jgi:hypothetical protein
MHGQVNLIYILFVSEGDASYDGYLLLVASFLAPSWKFFFLSLRSDFISL